MQSSAQSRKRPAPGASPLVQHQSTPPQPTYSYQQIPENADFNFDFSQSFNADQTFSDASFAPNSDFASYLQNAAQNPTSGSNLVPALPQTPSTELVKRPRNQQLAPPQHAQQQQQEQWNGGGGHGNMNGRTDDEDEQDLDRKVQLAKKDAQGKRKQIPPFVQKLSSFLDSNNTELIRWSDDGKSFIVLDEDEFARTLIPELFKHNNYASFVRQLNMYGFHKTVNITDGSLRQSEKARKGVKPPSMYSHHYFRRNRPDLLWLIQKPGTKAGAKRKRDGAVREDFGSDDERQYSPQAGVGTGPAVGELGAPSGSNGGGEMVTLPRNELAQVRHELQRLQNQQRFISKMIEQLKAQNDAFYRQASAFQALHDRHENSINAILTFLATFYNRNLESHGGAANLMNLFGGNAGQSQHQQQENRVVEEFPDGTSDGNNQLQRYVKKQPLLLSGPVSNLQQQHQSLSPQQPPGSAVTAPSSAPNDASKRGSTSSSAPPPDNAAKLKRNNTVSPVVKNDAPTPDMLNQVPENDQMMSLINSVNATNASTPPNAPAFDFSSALNHYQTANGNSPLTPQQRDDVLALMAANQPGQQGDGPSGTSGNRNAMISPQPPQMPDLNQLRETQQQLEMLTNLQKQQDEKVQELNRRLQPLSPTGAIPGVPQTGDENPFDLTGAPGDYDPSAFLNFDDHSWNDQGGGGAGGEDDDIFNFGTGPVGTTADDINWEFDPGDAGNDMFQTDTSGLAPPQQDGGGRIESVSSEATSPAHTVVEGAGEEGGTPGYKRQRRS